MTDVPTERVLEILAATRDHRLVPDHLSYDRHEIEAILTELLALRAALKPSAETKAAYIGEFHIAVERIVNEDDEAEDEGDVDPYEHIQVPWATIKQIMAAIAARALQSHSTGDDK